MSFYIIYFTIVSIFSLIYAVVEINSNKYLIKQNKKYPEKRFKIYSILFIHAIFYFTMMYTLLVIIIVYKVPKYFIIGYIIYLLALIIHWKTNNNECFITNLLINELNLPQNLGFRGIEHIVNDQYPVVSSEEYPISNEDIVNYYYSVYFFVIYSIFLYFIKS